MAAEDAAAAYVLEVQEVEAAENHSREYAKKEVHAAVLTAAQKVSTVVDGGEQRDLLCIAGSA